MSEALSISVADLIPRGGRAKVLGRFHPGRNRAVSRRKSVDRNSLMPAMERPSISSRFSQYSFLGAVLLTVGRPLLSGQCSPNRLRATMRGACSFRRSSDALDCLSLFAGPRQAEIVQQRQLQLVKEQQEASRLAARADDDKLLGATARGPSGVSGSQLSAASDKRMSTYGTTRVRTRADLLLRKTDVSYRSSVRKCTMVTVKMYDRCRNYVPKMYDNYDNYIIMLLFIERHIHNNFVRGALHKTVCVALDKRKETYDSYRNYIPKLHDGVGEYQTN